ncbi:MAG: TadE/TadG family type IV pilus assembly protein [Acidobacteriaceae bacterium]
MPLKRFSQSPPPALRTYVQRLRSETGASLVETAISISILLVLLIGIIEACLAVYTYHFIANAAREGTRYAIVRGNTWSEPPWDAGACAAYTDSACIASEQNVKDYVTSLAFPGISKNNINVAPATFSALGSSAPCSYTTCNAAGDVVKVTVTYTFPFDIPFMPSRSLTMSSSSQMIISQ